MATTAAYAATPLVDVVQLTATINTARDGTGTTTLIATGTASGKLIRRIVLCAAATTTAGVVRFFLSPDSGTTKRLVKEVLITALTPSTTVEVFRSEVDEMDGLVLPGTTYSIYGSTEKAETCNVMVESGGL